MTPLARTRDDLFLHSWIFALVDVGLAGSQ